MIISELTVEVRDSNYERVGQILPRDLVGFKAVLRFNNVGSWEIVLPDGHAVGAVLREPGSGIIVTYQGDVILSGPTVSATNTKTSDNPNGDWKIAGVDDSVLLGERLAYPDPSSADVTAQAQSNDVRIGLASTAMYGYVEANMGSLAPAARQVSNLVTATDTGLGSAVYPSARFNVLGELLNGIASIDGLGFDIRQVGQNLEFGVYQPVDRSGEIRMDVSNNTLSKTEYSYGIHQYSRAIVGGSGTGAGRKFVEVTSTESLSAETLWGRRIETFIDENNTDSTDELEQSGKEKLADSGKTLTSIDITPSSDLTMSYGLDWGLGDKVTVVVGNQEAAAVVTTVSMSVDPDGIRVGATVGEATGVDYEGIVAKRTTTTAARVNHLELKEVPSLSWNDTDGTYEFLLKGGNVTLQIGQEQVVRVKNATGSALTNGTVVYPTGSDGTNKTVAKAQANAESTSSMTFAVLTEDIGNGQKGFATTFGLVHDLDTSALTEGAAVYLSPTMAGALTSTKPTAPNHMVLVGFCIKSHAVNGIIFVKIQNGFELNELHDVAISSPAAGDLLVRNAGNTGWENETLASAGISAVGHVHSAADVTSGTLPVGRGGTGATSFTAGSYIKGDGTNALAVQTGIPSEDLPPGTILQVKQVRTQNQPTTTSNSPVNIPGLSISITPRSTSSAIYLTAMLNSGFSNSTGGWTYFNFARSGTDLIYATAGTGENTFANVRHVDNGTMHTTPMELVDFPSTTSAITYTVRWNVYSSNTASLNKRWLDTYFAGSSTFVVMEIAQ